MKRIILYSVPLLIIMIFTACGSQGNLSVEGQSSVERSNTSITMLTHYITFEEALLQSTDIVVANYIGHRNFGENTIEFEFEVLERVLGDSADRIFVYATNTHSSTIGATSSISYNNADLSFSTGGQYLLVLKHFWFPHSNIHEDGYVLVRNLVVDLDNPQNSTMYGETLSLHSELRFDGRGLTGCQIIGHAKRITKNSYSSAIEYIMSNDVDVIIERTEYILLVEVNELRSRARTDFQRTDIFYCTVIQVIKGDIEPGFELAMIFLADTVQPGEQHIIAVRRIEEGSSWFEFTSRNSLFEANKVDEIMVIVEQQQ